MGEQEGSYSALTASALIFNIIVGMGLWALPKLLYESGTIVAFTILGLSGLFNCIVSTFINELQGSSNAIRKLNLSSKPDKKVLPEDELTLLHNDDESCRLDEATVYAVTERFELTAAVSFILGPLASKINSLALIISLQVALMAYLTTFSETSRNLLCRPLTCQNDNYTETLNTENVFCGNYEFSEYTAYLLSLVFFLFATAPLCSLNIGDNSYVQLIGTVLRWVTITLVLMVSFFHLKTTESPKFSYSPTNWSKAPLMIGLANAAFGCQETLPSVLFPIRSKRDNNMMLFFCFIFILILYVTMTSTALTAFDGPDIADVFLLNFQNDCDLVSSKLVRLFLTSYPIIPATTNFVIFHVVCQRNIRVILSRPESTFIHSSRWKYHLEKAMIMMFASSFPVIVSVFALDVGVIFAVGGTFSSILSSWLFPTLMTWKSRQMLSHVSVPNPLQSPFKSIFWIITILAVIVFTITSNIIVQFSP